MRQSGSLLLTIEFISSPTSHKSLATKYILWVHPQNPAANSGAATTKWAVGGPPATLSATSSAPAFSWRQPPSSAKSPRSVVVPSNCCLLPHQIVAKVGMSLVIWVLSAAICIMGAFCYLELGTAVNRSGGDFAYLCFVKWLPKLKSFNVFAYNPSNNRRPIAFAFMITGCFLVALPIIIA
jgi:hypothetical protein